MFTLLQDGDETPEEALLDYYNDDNEIEPTIKRLDVVPTQEPQVVPLDGGDYEKILYFLDKIESGEYHQPLNY